MTGDHYFITMADVIEARQLMRTGLSLKETAERMDVLSGQLDFAIWGAFGKSDEELMPPRLHVPDF